MTSDAGVPATVVEREMSPGRRLVIVSTAAAGVSIVFHVGLPPLVRPIGETLFPGPFGGVGVIVMGVAVGFATMALVLVVLNIRQSVDVWMLGCPLAMIYGLLALNGLRLWATDSRHGELGSAAFASFVAADTAGVVIGFLLAAVVSEKRFRRGVRFGLPVATVIVTAVIGATVYQIRYGS